MTTPLENLPAKPLRFIVERRGLIYRSIWLHSGVVLAHSSQEAMLRACNAFSEAGVNLRIAGISFLASEIVPRQKSAGE